MKRLIFLLLSLSLFLPMSACGQDSGTVKTFRLTAVGAKPLTERQADRLSQCPLVTGHCIVYGMPVEVLRAVPGSAQSIADEPLWAASEPFFLLAFSDDSVLYDLEPIYGLSYNEERQILRADANGEKVNARGDKMWISPGVMEILDIDDTMWPEEGGWIDSSLNRNRNCYLTVSKSAEGRYFARYFYGNDFTQEVFDIAQLYRNSRNHIAAGVLELSSVCGEEYAAVISPGLFKRFCTLFMPQMEGYELAPVLRVEYTVEGSAADFLDYAKEIGLDLRAYELTEVE
ncbi:MAG: hypothetical protein DBY36_02950 [Clostridiales bacterium]|nr:MAG: hypothetical protein DBY36_02950 [Clostridiales bacterium]